MEQVWIELAKLGVTFTIMGIVVFFLYRKNDKYETEIKTLNSYILDREKEISEERMEEQKEVIAAMNNVATELSKHNKLTEDEQRKKT